MGEQTAPIITILVLLIAVVAVIALGGGMLITANKMGQVDATTVAEVQRTFMFSYVTVANLMIVLKAKLISCIFALFSVVSASIAVFHFQYAYEDKVYVGYRNNVIERITRAKYTIPKLPKMQKKDDLVVMYEDAKFGFFGYLFTSSQHYKKAESMVAKLGQEIEVCGKVETVGGYYKVGNIMLKRGIILLKEDSDVNITIYTYSTGTIKLPDETVICNDFELVS